MAQMRLVKMLGLAVLAGLTAMASIGAGAASADVACKENVGHLNTCPADKIVIENHSIKGKSEATPVKFLNLEKTQVECGSEILGQVKANQGAHKGLLVLITKWEFTNCKGLCKKAKGHSLPFLMEVIALDLHVIITKHPDEGLRPAVLFEECTELKVNCLYEFGSEETLWNIKNDLLISDRWGMLRSGHSMICPTSEEFDATYKLYLDTIGNLTGVWPTALP
jgi:hypothetical protein